MKLDSDLVRTILIAYEDLPYGGREGNFEFDGYSHEQILYHQEILVEAGYIKADIAKFVGNDAVVIAERLTYKGHEFLNASRDEGRWKIVKDALNKSGGIVMEVAQALLIAALREQFHLP